MSDARSGAPRGRLLVLEGPEGVGKSTHVRQLSGWLEARGVPYLAVREPGGTPLGDEIRRLLLDDPERHVLPRAEALLFMASRAQLVEAEIRPALAAGTLVIADRFFLSTYAYQIVGRGLPEAEIRTANALATAGLVPDLTLLIHAPPGAGMARVSRRGQQDRLERSGDDFHRRVADAFARFADPAWQREHPECGPVLAVDGRGGVGDGFERIMALLATRWPETFASFRESHS